MIPRIRSALRAALRAALNFGLNEDPEIDRRLCIVAMILCAIFVGITIASLCADPTIGGLL